MKDSFNIYIDRLQDGNTEKIKFAGEPAFLEIKEADLQFPEKVEISGDAYLADDQLVVHLNIRTTAVLPCLMCNEPAVVPLDIKNFYHVEPVEDIKGGVFDYKADLREAILLQVPSYAECHNGRCPRRDDLNKFLKKPEATTFPFSGLDK